MRHLSPSNSFGLLNCEMILTPVCLLGDVLILEEAAYCDEGFFYETASRTCCPICCNVCYKVADGVALQVAPILSIGSASLVAISTLTSEISKLLTL